MNKKGFSLSEILIIIVILGVLVSMAMPKYNKVLEKTRAAEAISLLRSLYNSEKNYQIVNGKFADSFKDLDFHFSGQKFTCKKNDNSNCWGYYNTEAIRGKRWSVELEKGRNPSISVGIVEGPYAGAGFFIQLERASGVQYPLEKIACAENILGRFQYKGKQGSYCEDIMNAIFYNDKSTTSRKYQLPS